MKFTFSYLWATSVLAISASNRRQTILGTSIVNLNNNTGPPAHLASGFIYGIPDVPNQIPDHFYTDIGFNYARAGGAQVLAPGRGWIWGITEYKNRFASALSNYKTTRKYNGHFIFLIHDLWGADGTQNSTAAYPGDDGDWTSWDEYLTYFIADIKANDATAGLSIDIWNEPDLTYFWNRSLAQYIQLWGRTWYRLRKELPGVLLIGPALANSPSSTNEWWTTFSSFVSVNQSVPDQWVWHMETGGGDLLTSQAELLALQKTYHLTPKQINIDEYATYPEQNPAGATWWISQLERINAIGLRGNWLSTTQLHDFLASLLSKPSTTSPTSTGYFPNGEYQVYKYYNQNMTGYRVGTLPSSDKILETYAVVGVDKVRVLTGVRLATGTWQVTINSLTSVGLPASGSLSIHTWGFPFTGSHFGEVDGPVGLGVVAHKYSGGSVTFPIYQLDTTTAYAFEFVRG